MSRRRKLPLEPVLATIEALSHEGRGITHVDGKTIFIDGALKGESVIFRYRGSRAKFAEGSIEELIDNISVDRVEPACKHYSVCGGCSLQHMSAKNKYSTKSRSCRNSCNISAVSQQNRFSLPLQGHSGPTDTRPVSASNMWRRKIKYWSGFEKSTVVMLQI